MSERGAIALATCACLLGLASRLEAQIGLSNFAQVRLGKRPGIGITREQCRRHQVHAHIGALCGQDRGDQQLQVIAMAQSTRGFGVKRGQPGQKLGDGRISRVGLLHGRRC